MCALKRVFLDTEFTDFKDPHLISLALVADTGEELYIEVPYPLSRCSEFVKEAVLPALGKIPGAFCAIDDVRSRLIDWLTNVRSEDEDVVVAYDYETDWLLMHAAMKHRAPLWCRNTLIWSHLDDLKVEQYFVLNRDAQQHHALHDARANKFGYRGKPVEFVAIQCDKHSIDKI